MLMLMILDYSIQYNHMMKDFVAPVSLAEPTEKDKVDSAALERVRVTPESKLRLSRAPDRILFFFL